MRKSVILAAGKGTRMQSDLPKVVHKVCGREMINRVLDVTKACNVDRDIVVVGYKGDVVKEAIDRDVDFAIQTEQLGTGHAVKSAKDYIEDDDVIVVLYGDSPLLKAETLNAMFKYFEDTNADITLTTAVYDVPPAYGRIIKDENGIIMRIVEQKDATEEEKLIKEVNIGFGIYKGKALKESLEKLNNNNAAGEYYLTDVPEVAYKNGLKVNSFNLEDKTEGFGPNSKDDLAKAEEIWLSRQK